MLAVARLTTPARRSGGGRRAAPRITRPSALLVRDGKSRTLTPQVRSQSIADIGVQKDTVPPFRRLGRTQRVRSMNMRHTSWTPESVATAWAACSCGRTWHSHVSMCCGSCACAVGCTVHLGCGRAPSAACTQCASHGLASAKMAPPSLSPSLSVAGWRTSPAAASPRGPWHPSSAGACG